MNLQIFIFSLLLIVAYGYYSLADKHVASAKLRTHYVAYQKNYRTMLNQFQSNVYHHLPKAPKNTSTGKKPQEASPKEEEEEEEEDFSTTRACARLNLWPLIQDGKEAHPHLYELFAKLIRTFYGSLNKNARFEYKFLDAWLQAASHLDLSSQGLENAHLATSDFQTLYYKMLKGSAGLPPLLEYVKIESSADKICVFHANQTQLSLLFPQNIAEKLYTKIHSKEGPRLSAELIERIASECQSFRIDPHLMALLDTSNYFKHQDLRPFFVTNEGDITLRKRFIMAKPR